MDFALVPHHRYPIHDNGGRPFLVEERPHTRACLGHEQQVVVYGGETHPRPGEVLLTLDSLATYVAQGETSSTPDGRLEVCPEVAGNTILVCVGEDLRRPGPGVVRSFTYVWVGPEVLRFGTDEPVFEFRSPLGNSNVPYAYAHTKSWTYLLTERVRVPRIGGGVDPYRVYYEMGLSRLAEHMECSVVVPRVGGA